tara:strand:+ start:247 stop:585 length:339 start_codon:yes stop_codon:yes gene_type:complete
MRIENFSEFEWVEISEILSKHSFDEPVIKKLLAVIKSRTDLFNLTHDFLTKNKFNPIFFPDRPSIEKCKDGKGLTKRFTMYEGKKGKGIIQFKKDYQEYILERYKITEKQEV